MYGISERVYSSLLDYFEKNSNIKKVILFGSRAKGNERINSDIDLCVECTKDFKHDIVEEIDEIVGIYSVDILFLDSLNLEIKDQIDKYGIEIYANEL